VLDDQRARQREGVARHPRPGDHGPVAATEVLGVGEDDAGAGATAEQALGGSQRGEHRPGETAQVANHRLRPYPAGIGRPAAPTGPTGWDEPDDLAVAQSTSRTAIHFAASAGAAGWKDAARSGPQSIT
jgi:hypothetical protein